MSEINSAWPFGEIGTAESLDIDKIFGSGVSSIDNNPLDAAQEPPASQSIQPAPAAQAAPLEPAAAQPAAAPSVTEQAPSAPRVEEPESNPIAAAFEEKTVENAQKGLLEKPPYFMHRGAKEPIEDASMTFEELRIRKSDDFADLEEGKFVSWTVEYCGIRKEIKDPKGTTIISVKEMIERSHAFLDALKKAKDKNPDCYVKPKITGKNKGTAAYRGNFNTLEEAMASDKVICLIPSDDGRIYELRKTEQGNFIAPQKKVTDFQRIRAGFIPTLPLIPRSLLEQIIFFFRCFMWENEEYEVLALIYWDKVKKEFFAYVPKQSVTKDHIDADLRECPYDDESRYIRYADIHSHNSMDAIFSPVDDRDERDTGLYLVVGNLQEFYPDIKARFFCGGTFVPLDPSEIIEGMDRRYPTEWERNVSYKGRFAQRESHLNSFAEKVCL